MWPTLTIQLTGNWNISHTVGAQILAAPIKLQNVAPPSRLWSHLMRPDLLTIIVHVCRLDHDG